MKFRTGRELKLNGGWMKIYMVGALAVLLTCSAQTDLSGPTFEVASLKKADPNSPGPPNVCKGGPGTSDPGLFSCTNEALSGLILQAYHLQFYELVSPDWVIHGGANGYDVTAKIPPGTDRDRFRLMLQKLLADRFHLAVHKETRSRPVYVLQRGKHDPKLAHSTAPPPPGPRTSYDFPSGHMRFSMHNSPLSTLTGFLTVQVAAPVTDETGLQGDYDLTLEFMPDERFLGFADMTHDAKADASVPDLSCALEEQLGLGLEARKRAVEVLVVDRAEKIPVAN
jgi:uncharacterized protein (TIGR03435 family)